MNTQHVYLAIPIYGGFEGTVCGILWPELENDENQGNGSPSRGNLLSNSTPIQGSPTINCVTQALFSLNFPQKMDIW
jgi:hypothetical protein